ncbi:MAG: transcriptional repressor LexA [Firmicutes bacterium]|nr:transcriptional repressor LexA [Bacillota bacterium]
MTTLIKNIDKKLQELLSFIEKYITENNYPPSVREMGAAVKVNSTSTVAYYLDRLEAANLIKRHGGGKHRTWDLVNRKAAAPRVQPNTTLVPLLGAISAGQPILAVENYEDVFYMPSNLFRGEGLFMLTVKGESMIEDGIFNGDKVVIKQQPTAENGEIVAAMVEDSATVKRFYKEQNKFRLQPANSAMDPMYFTEVKILGKVVGLIRKI